MQHITNTAIEEMNTEQKALNRQFHCLIRQGMEPAYEQCNQDRGTGVTKRRKGYLHDHINHGKDIMFRDATDGIQKALDAAIRHNCSDIEARLDESILASLKRDYMSAFGRSWDKLQLSSEQERAIRTEVQREIESVAVMFHRVINPDDDTGDAASNGSTAGERMRSDENAVETQENEVNTMTKENSERESVMNESELADAMESAITTTNNECAMDPTPSLDQPRSIEKQGRDSGNVFIRDGECSVKGSPDLQQLQSSANRSSTIGAFIRKNPSKSNQRNALFGLNGSDERSTNVLDAPKADKRV